MSDQDYIVRKNLSQSRKIVLLVFSANSGLNVILLGALANIGGMNLVGEWALLSSILLAVTLADFGVTNALTYRIGRDGLETNLPLIRSLVFIAFSLSLIVLLAAPVAMAIYGTWGLAIALTTLAALGEMLSNWLISIRMGRHEQYWFNVKTLVRVVLQTILALSLCYVFYENTALAFSIGLLASRCGELFLSWWMVRSELSLGRPRASLREIGSLTRGFGLLSLTQKGMDPISRIMVSILVGPAALGVFTVARRIPAVINQSVSEALRALLPGISRFRDASDQSRVHALLRDAVAGQLVMVGAPMLIIVIHANTFFRVWLGQTDTVLATTLTLLMGGAFSSAVTRPLFWTVQAFGDADKLARVTLTRVSFTLLLGVGILFFFPKIELFALIYAGSQVVSGVLAFKISQDYDKLASKVFSILPRRAISFFIIWTAFLNLLLLCVPFDFSPVLQLIIIAVSNGALVAPFGFLILRKKGRANV